MKNRLQFNRHYAEYQSREEALTAFRARITDPDFIPLIGEPIVLRYKDENDKLQLILAVGKKAGRSLDEREYHFIDTAELDEKLAAEIAAREELDAETIKNIFFNDVEAEISDNVASLSVSANSMPIGNYENYDGRVTEPHPIHDEYSVLDAIKQLDVNAGDNRSKVNELSGGTVFGLNGLNTRCNMLQTQIDEEKTYRKSIKLKQLNDEQIREIYGDDNNINEAYYLVDHHNYPPTNQDTIVKVYKDSVTPEDINSFNLEYDSENRKIILSWEVAGVEQTSVIDANDFIKDGMVDTVRLFTPTQEWIDEHPEYSYANLEAGKPYLWITFNTESEKEPADIFIKLDSLVDVYTVGPDSKKYLDITDYVLSAKVDVEDGLASYNSVNYVSAITDNIIKAAGLVSLTEEGTYPKNHHSGATVIGPADSLDDADMLLDFAVAGLSGALLDLSAATSTSDIAPLSGAVINLSGAVKANEDAIAALSAGTRQLSADTKAAIDALKDEMSACCEDVFDAISGLSGMLSAATDEIYDYIDQQDSALTEDIEGLRDEMSACCEEVKNEIVELSGNIIEYVDAQDEALSGNVIDYIDAALRDLTGADIPLTGYELSSGETPEELLVNENDSINDAFGKVQKQILDNKDAMDDALGELSGSVVANLGELSGSVVENAINIEVLSAATMKISGLTDGVLTLNFGTDPAQSFKYSPSADTTLNVDVNAANVILTDAYEMSSADTREELALMSGDSATEAFGKISKIIYLDELISSAAFNDLNDRVLALNEEVAVLHDEIGVRIREAIVEVDAEIDDVKEDVDENTNDIAALSADVAANEAKIDAISGDVMANRTDINTLSASMIDNELVIAAAFNDVNDRILDMSADTNNKISELSANTANYVTCMTVPGLNIWTGTRTSYDAIVSKDPNTLYIITSGNTI